METQTATVRPTTAGNLYDRLKAGQDCEVLASVKEFASLALKSISIIKREKLEIKTFPSDNTGWVIYQKVLNRNVLMSNQDAQKIIDGLS